MPCYHPLDAWRPDISTGSKKLIFRTMRSIVIRLNLICRFLVANVSAVALSAVDNGLFAVSMRLLFIPKIALSLLPIRRNIFRPIILLTTLLFNFL